MRKGFVFWAMTLCMALLFTAASCDPEPDIDLTSSSPSSEQNIGTSGTRVYETFSLPYNHTALFNPFVTQSALNLYLSQLVAEGLTKPDGKGGAENILALSVTPSAGNTVYTVKLRPDRIFSDGSPVTSADVVASAEQVRANPSGSYGTRLRKVISVTDTDEETVVFTLAKADPCFAAMLSFPIVKNGSIEENYIGTGPYCLSTDDGGNLQLTANPMETTAPATKVITLAGTDNASLLHYMLETGDIDCYYTSRPAKTPGSFSVWECDAMTDGFLAFDLASFFGSDATFRKLLSGAIDRQRLIQENDLFASLPVRGDTLLTGTGTTGEETVPTETPVSTEEPATTDEPMATEDPTPETLADYLSMLGYSYTDADGYRYRQQGRQVEYVELTLAYLSADEERDRVAETLVTLLAEEGSKLTIVPYDSMTDLTNGLYLSPADMVYGELTLSPNLDMTALLDPTAGLSAFLHGDYALWQTYENYLLGNVDGAAVDAALQKTLPFTTLYSRKGRILYHRLFAEGVRTDRYSVYYGAENWYKYE